MASIKYKLTTDGAIFQAANREAITNEEIRAYLTASSKLLEREVFNRTPHNTGLTRGSLFSAVRGVAQGRGVAVVSLPVEHADVLEDGGKPHWAPIAPIILWAQQRYRDKGGSVRMAAKSIKKERKLRTQKQGLLSFAYAVRAAIAKRGTRAHHMFREAERIWKPAIEGSMFTAMVEKIAKRLSDVK